MDKPVQLKQLNDTTFIAFDNYKIIFVKKEKSEFNRIKLIAPTFSSYAIRVVYVNYTSQKLMQFAGYYYSKEVNAVYHVIVKGDSIVLENLRNGEMVLSPKTKDRFSCDKWYLSKVVFERSPKNEVVSFRVSSDRMYNVLFKRISLDK